MEDIYKPYQLSNTLGKHSVSLLWGCMNFILRGSW